MTNCPLKHIYFTSADKKKTDTKSERKSVSAGRREKAIDAALRFGRCVARVFEDNLRRYDPEDDDDIDKQLRREIQAVKNGQNLVM